VLDCKKIIVELKEALEPDRWHTIWHLFRLCVQRAVRSRDVMKKLQEEFTKEELEEFGMYRLGREEGLAEGRAEGRADGVAEGRAEGQRELIANLLTALLRRKFGDPPDWVREKLRQITSVEAGKRLLLRIEDASSLDEIWSSA
jgi:flagellar biosynthesis/type III secretory pathway protein FliH